jgi:hypothetical protein
MHETMMGTYIEIQKEHTGTTEFCKLLPLGSIGTQAIASGKIHQPY